MSTGLTASGRFIGGASGDHVAQNAIGGHEHAANMRQLAKMTKATCGYGGMAGGYNFSRKGKMTFGDEEDVGSAMLPTAGGKGKGKKGRQSYLDIDELRFPEKYAAAKAAHEAEVQAKELKKQKEAEEYGTRGGFKHHIRALTLDEKRELAAGLGRGGGSHSGMQEAPSQADQLCDPFSSGFGAAQPPKKKRKKKGAAPAAPVVRQQPDSADDESTAEA